MPPGCPGPVQQDCRDGGEDGGSGGDEGDLPAGHAAADRGVGEQRRVLVLNDGSEVGGQLGFYRAGSGNWLSPIVARTTLPRWAWPAWSFTPATMNGSRLEATQRRAGGR